MTWEYIRGVAVGQMGMSNEDFLNSDFKEVLDAIKGFQIYEQNKFRNQWEQTRWLATISLQPYSGKGKTIKMTDLIQFDWEKQEKPKTRELSKEQIEWRKRMDAIMRKNHGQA